MSLLDYLRASVKTSTFGLAMATQEILYKWFGRNRQMSRDEEENIEGDVVVVTGAGRGMGAKISEQFAKRGATVVLGCIDMEEGAETVKYIKTQTGNSKVEMIHLDLGDLASVENFAAEIRRKYLEIRILVNNGGILLARGNTLTKDGFNVVMAVNYFGHFLLTNLLLENLKRGKPSRVVSLSSSAQHWHKLDLKDIHLEKSGFGPLDSLPYNNSKYALALFMKELGNRMLGTGVTTYALCPGMVKTDFFEDCQTIVTVYLRLAFSFAGFTAEEAASEFILYHALSKKVAHETGIMYRYKKHFTSANKILKDSTAKELWDLSAHLVSLEQRQLKVGVYRESEESGFDDATK